MSAVVECRARGLSASHYPLSASLLLDGAANFAAQAMVGGWRIGCVLSEDFDDIDNATPGCCKRAWFDAVVMVHDKSPIRLAAIRMSCHRLLRYVARTVPVQVQVQVRWSSTSVIGSSVATSSQPSTRPIASATSLLRVTSLTAAALRW